MSIQGQMTYTDIVAMQKQQKEQDFWSGLMYHAMQTDDFSSVGGRPTYTEGASPLPSKDASWREYLKMKNGRVTPEEMNAFHQQYEALEGQRNSGQLQGLNKLQAMGATPSQIRSMVKDNPQLYNNLIDMTTKLSATGDENAIAMASQFQQYLPQKGMLDKASDYITDNPGIASIGALFAAGAASKYGPGVGDSLKKFFLSNPDALLTFEDLASQGKDGKYSHNVDTKRLNLKPGEGSTLEQFLNNEIAKDKNGEYRYTDEYDKNRKRQTKTKVKRSGSKVSASTADRIKKLEAAGGPKMRNIWGNKSMKKGFSMGIPGLVAMFAAPTLGRAVGGEVGERVGKGGVGAYMVAQGLQGRAMGQVASSAAGKKMFQAGGKTLASFGTKLAARHAAAGMANLHPVALGALLLVDLGFGLDYIAESFGFDLIPFL